MSYTPLQLAEAFIKTGELADALDALNDHLRQHPDDHETRRLRASVLLRTGEEPHLRQALADLEGLAHQTAGDHLQRSLLYERLDRGASDRAVTAARQARRSAPDDDRILERLLYLYTGRGAYAEALALVRSQPPGWRWTQWEADLLVQLGDDRGAAERYGQVLTQMDQAQSSSSYLHAIRGRILLARAHAYRRLHRIDEAWADYRAAHAILPTDPTIPFHQGLLQALSGDLDGAVHTCQEALETAPAGLQPEMLAALNEDTAYRPLADKLRSHSR